MKTFFFSRIAAAVFVMAVTIVSPWAQAQDDQSSEVTAWFEEGQSLLENEEFGKAAEQFEKCVAANDSFGPGWFMLGYALHMDGQLEKAMKAHQRAIDAKGNDQFRPIATYNMACAHALLGKPEPALKYLREAFDAGYEDVSHISNDSDLFSLHSNPVFAEMMAELKGDEDLKKQLAEAQQAIAANDYEKAAELYAAIAKKYPRNDFACYRLGYALHGAGKLDEAITHHQKATEFAATKGIGFYNWGCALSLKGEADAAIEKLEKAVEHGFLRLEAYESDEDLANIREKDGFKALVKKVREKSEGKEKPTEKKSEG